MMDQQEIDRLEQLRAKLESEMDVSSDEAWKKSWKRLEEVYKTGDIYPAVMAARALSRMQPKGSLPPDNIGVFDPTLRMLRRETEEGLEGQDLMIYRAKMALRAQSERDRADRQAERLRAANEETV